MDWHFRCFVSAVFFCLLLLKIEIASEKNYCNRVTQNPILASTVLPMTMSCFSSKGHTNTKSDAEMGTLNWATTQMTKLKSNVDNLLLPHAKSDSMPTVYSKAHITNAADFLIRDALGMPKVQ